MELLIRITEDKDGIKSEEEMKFTEDAMLRLTQQKLWSEYVSMVGRLEKRHDEFKSSSQNKKQKK